jgi:hypothetical protein
MRWAGHIACMGEMRNACNILVGKPKGKRPLGRPGHNGRIILDWILGNRVEGCGLDASSSE